MMQQYHPKQIEHEAQTYWQTHQTFHAEESKDKEKYYCLCMFPYPSGKLHMGHVRNYTIGDVIARFQKMQGKNVLQPMGWDAFGLPAENAAIQHKVPPAKWTYQNIEHMKGQLQQLGLGYDWERELATCQPEYYRWEQWFFLKLYEKGLVYRKNSVVNWDPVDQTVLANEQVIDGRGWRSGALVERKEIPQWFIKITDYAEALLKDIEQLEGWPNQVRLMQKNWIGRSVGATVYFEVKDHTNKIEIFTTCPDTLLGVTFMAVAAEHPLAKEAAQSNPQMAKFIEECKHTKTAEADLATLEKHGLDTGFKAINPLNGEEIPIWVANYVLSDYGSGAVMAVPGHDARDWEFAKQYNLPIVQVVEPLDGARIDVNDAVFSDKGRLVNSEPYNGLDYDGAFEAIVNDLQKKQAGHKTIQFRLRDWGVSRQRYWGTPIPMIYCEDCGTVPVKEADLPVVLPESVTLTGAGSPLGSMPEFYQVDCPQCGKQAKRETDTFDTFFESSWYYARFSCADQKNAMVDERAKYWTPVDQYIGGIEHACLHLLYARFFHKAMRDMGLVSGDEPFKNLLTQGMVLKDGAKMSKSRGNTVDPQDLVEQYGADTVRMFIMFTSPPEQSLEWSDAGVEGAFRFLKRLWQAVQQHIAKGHAPALDASQFNPAQRELWRKLHETLAKVTDDMQRRFTFNTAIAAVMELMNALSRHEGEQAQDLALAQAVLSHVALMLSPIVPHISHALWLQLGHQTAVIDSPWPKVDESALVRDTLEMVVQVNGKVRGHIEVAMSSSKEDIEQAALAQANVVKHIEGKQVRKVIVVPKKLVNVVVGG